MTLVPEWAEHAARALRRERTPKIMPLALGPLAPVDRLAVSTDRRINVSENAHPSDVRPIGRVRIVPRG